MPAAVILAGGAGERLGGALKSEVRVGDVRLLDRVATRLGGCRPLLVSHGRHDPILLHLGPGMLPVADIESDYAGPLAGLCGALDWLARSDSPAELIVSVAVDTPFLPANYVERLADALGDAAVAMAAYAGQEYPTNAIWRVSACRDLPERVRRGTAPHSLRRLAAELGPVLVDWSPGEAENPFANANTPAELELLHQRATSTDGSFH